MKKRLVTLCIAVVMIFAMFSADFSSANAANTDNGNVILSIPWNLINQCGYQKESGPCMAYCWAYCHIILDNQPHSYQEYWDGTQAKGGGYNGKKDADTMTEMLRIVYDNINSGYPVVLHVRGTAIKDKNGNLTGKYNDHFVVAIGYRAGSDPDNLQQGDILILNPSSKAIDSSAGSKETYTYLDSCTLTMNRYWTAKSGTGGQTTTTSKGPDVTSGSPENVIVVSSTADGSWTVTVPANYKLVCYASANATKRSPNYISAQKAPYSLYCTQQATLSNGKTRYFFTSGDGKKLWFDFTSSMSVVSNASTPAKSYTVNFNANGGSVGQASKTVTNGQRYGDLPMPSLNGYIFDGWFTSANRGTLVTAATTVNLTGNQTLYAHWTKEPTTTYTVTFDPNGGTVSPTTKTVPMGTPLSGMPTPSRSGYTFKGWTVNRIDPDSKTLQSTAIVSDGVYTFDENTTLYAFWVKEPNTSQGVVKPTYFDYSGKFGVNNALTWGLNTSTGVLVLSGNGKMQNWSNAENRPWAKLRNTVTGVLIEDGVQNIGQYAVARCENMTDISIPESVTEIGDGAFIDVYSLKSLKLPNSLTKIGSSAFSGCTSLKSITIPKNVDFIGTGAFGNCANLESVYFCGNAPSYFGDNGIVRLNMFSGCRNLTVYYPANSSGWTQIIEKYTDVTWKTWDTGDTTSSSSNGSSNSTHTSVPGPWSEWSSTPYSESDTREVQTQQVKISEAYTEYRYGLWRNANGASWCPEYGASFSSTGGSWYEAYSSWSTTPMYDTGHNAYCAGSNHTHTHISGYDSNGWANWDIYSADGNFTGWNRVYYYWEETRTVPAVYETQYRYRDWISE